MSLREDLRRAVFGEGAAYRPREWRSKEGRIRQARGNLEHVLDDWVEGGNPFNKKFSLNSYTLPESSGGWREEWRRAYHRFYQQAWFEFEKIRAEVTAEEPEVMAGLEAEAGKEEAIVLNGLGYEERFANLPAAPL